MAEEIKQGDHKFYVGEDDLKFLTIISQYYLEIAKNHLCI